MMIFKCHTCTKEIQCRQMIGTLPPNYPLPTYCEECYKKLIEQKSNPVTDA